MPLSDGSTNRSRWLIIPLAVGLLGGLGWLLAHFHCQEVLQQILTKIQQLGWIGPIAFIGVYALATVMLLPGSVLTLGAGVLFGLVGGSIYTLIGATLGAAAAFLIGRYLARNWVQRQIDRYPNFQTVSQAVGNAGFKIVFLTRLSPAFPFNLLNYAYGLTSVSFQDYCLASIGMIPGTMMYVYIGSLAGSLATIGQASTSLTPQAQMGRLLLQAIGLGATVLVTIYVTQVARRALKAATLEPDPIAPTDLKPD
jgi:uncharacterized membrane protein YdjX (TVP38/TMEM64 family)